jgi:hypothetical protein
MRKNTLRATTRKGIAAVLAAVMLLVMLPVAVFAAEDAAPELATAAESAAPARAALKSEPDFASAKAPLEGGGGSYVYIAYTDSSDTSIPFTATGAAAQGPGWSWNSTTLTLKLTGNLDVVYFYSDDDDAVTVEYSGNISLTAGIWGDYAAITLKGTGKTGDKLTTSCVGASNGAATIQNANIEIAPYTLGNSDEEISSYGNNLTITNSTISSSVEDLYFYTEDGKLTITDSNVNLSGAFSDIASVDGNILIQGKSNIKVGYRIYAKRGNVTLNITNGGRVEIGTAAEPTGHRAIDVWNDTKAAAENGLILGTGVQLLEPTDGKILPVKDSLSQDYVTTVLTGSYGIYVYDVNYAAHVVFYAAKTGWNPFTDVKSGDWYFKNVKFIYEHWLFAGTSDTTFEPSTAMSRAMLVQVLWSYEGKPEPAKLSGFSDVPTDAYYAKAVAWALENEIVSGIGNNEFGPGKSVSRQDFVLILTKYAAKKSVTLPTTRAYAEFTDQASIAGYAKSAVEAAYRAKIIGGKDGGIFDPASGATRAEVAVMLNQYVLIAGE